MRLAQLFKNICEATTSQDSFTEEDVEIVMRVHQEDYDRNPDDWRERSDGIIWKARGSSRDIAIVRDDRIVGVLSLEPFKDGYIVDSVAVDEEFQGRGLSILLYRDALRDHKLYAGTQTPKGIAVWMSLIAAGRIAYAEDDHGGTVEITNPLVYRAEKMKWPCLYDFYFEPNARLFEMNAGRPPLLVLVHPGSACGSANFNLGRFQARAERDGLILDLNRWQGALLVADGELSDELPDYAELNGAILGALQRAREAGFVSVRIAACAHQHVADWTNRILRAVKTAGYVAGETVSITGAWVGEHGCVNATQDILASAGYPTNILDSAIHEADEDDDDDVDEDEQP